MKKIRWGIVGLGKIARKFASDVSCSEYAEITVVASTSEDRAKTFANDFGISRYFTDYQKLFSDNEVDAIYIATPNNLHFSNSFDAITAGKAVLCEKPLTCNSVDTQRLVEYAKERNIYLMEAMWTYFLPVLNKSKEWVEKGRIGKIKRLKADFGFKAHYDASSRLFNEKLGGGSLLDIGIYPIAFHWYFHSKIPENMQVVIDRAPTGVDQDVSIQFSIDKSVAQLGCSFVADLPNSAYIIGEKGYIHIPDFWMANSCYLYKDKKLEDEFLDNRTTFGLNYEVDKVSMELLEGKTIPEVVSHNDSVVISKLIDKVKSAT